MDTDYKRKWAVQEEEERKLWEEPWARSGGGFHTDWPDVEQQINRVRDSRSQSVTSDTLCSPWGTAKEDPVNPSHYKQGSQEVHDVIGDILSRLELQPQSYADLSNVLKYILRVGLKGGTLEELKKAQWYLNKLVERENDVPTRGDDTTGEQV